MIWFLSDNGPPAPDFGGAGSTGGLRGFKTTVFEGGVRTPGIVYWPRKIIMNAIVADKVTSLVDIRPTIRQLLQVESAISFSDESLLDGVSLLSLIESPDTWNRNKDLLICHPSMKKSDRICPHYALYRNGYKAIVTRGKASQLTTMPNALFDLRNDRSERKNRIRLEPSLYLELADAGQVLMGSILDSFRENRCSFLID